MQTLLNSIKIFLFGFIICFLDDYPFNKEKVLTIHLNLYFNTCVCIIRLFVNSKTFQLGFFVCFSTNFFSVGYLMYFEEWMQTKHPIALTTWLCCCHPPSNNGLIIIIHHGTPLAQLMRFGTLMPLQNRQLMFVRLVLNRLPNWVHNQWITNQTINSE